MDSVIAYLTAILILVAIFYSYVDFKRVGANLWVWVLNLLKVLTNPKMLLTFGIAWMITNGWSYLFVGFGMAFHLDWMLGVGSAYQAFLWFPFTAEKVVTVAIAIILAKWLFPKDLTLQERLKELSPKNIVKGG